MTSIACPPDESTTVNARSPSAPAPTTDNGQLTTDAARAARNRANAAKSTSPRTPRGKARSSQNATTHGLTALTPPPDLALDADFQQSKDELTEEYRPTTPTQVCLVNQLAHLTWKLDQIPKLERQILSAPLDDAAPVGWAPPTATPAADPTLALTALHLLQDRPTPLTRLWDHHRRLLARTQSIVRQLLQLRAHHQKRLEQDAADEAALAQSERADRANAAERAYQARQRHLEDERRTLAAAAAAAPPPPTNPCQSAPNCSKAPHPSTSAQNEPTPADPPPPSPKAAKCVPSHAAASAVGEGGGEGRLAHLGATPRHEAAHFTAPPQNEPTTDNGPLTMDTTPPHNGQQTTDQGHLMTTFSPPDSHNTSPPLSV